jgi:hypothetical protein
MFVNDTARLPDSGRVCIMGFQSEPAAANTWYSITVIAARAEVEPMANRAILRTCWAWAA